MPTYVIGDIHGCFRTLLRLLEKLRFEPTSDRLWLVGDLVNRGTGSLETLRWARGLAQSAVTVLGNHDLHLLALADGRRRKKPGDTLDAVLQAPDRRELLDWLRRRPLLHRQGSNVLVHAGLLPAWTIEQAERLAAEAQQALTSSLYPKILQATGKAPPSRWKDERSEVKRIMTILAAFTRLRCCTSQGRMCLDFSGPPSEAPRGCLPWFSFPQRKTEGLTIFFGHWAAMGVHVEKGVRALDSGCAWGGALTAVRLEDGELFQQPCAASDIPQEQKKSGIRSQESGRRRKETKAEGKGKCPDSGLTTDN